MSISPSLLFGASVQFSGTGRKESLGNPPKIRRNCRLFPESSGSLLLSGTAEAQLVIPFSADSVHLTFPEKMRAMETLQPKMAYLLPPGASLRLEWPGTAEILVVRLGGKVLADAAGSLGLSAPALEGFRVSDTVIFSVASMLRDTFALQQKFPPLVSISATSLLAVRVLSLARKGGTGEKREQLSPSAFTRVITFVESHLDEDFGLEEMARSAGCSRFHFARAFKSRIGMSPWQYVTRCRLNRAETLLRTKKELSVAEICHAVGFQDQSHFTRAFKSAFSVTPGSFRRKA